MKFCPNNKCVAFGRVVYTQSTRCVFCRWDLKPPRMLSETVENTAKGAWTDTHIVPARAEPPAPPKRPPLRHSA